MAEPYDASAAMTSAMGAALPPGNWAWGDQGDGTYTNPILPGDYSDLDAIGVGGDYYAISSTFQFSPGIILLHSKDLVNWSMLGHLVEDLTQIGPELNWDAMGRYGKGIWAPAIRYHNSKYRVYFCTPDEGLFVTTAASPAGPWAPFQQLFAWAGWDDCCPFWDDDGQGYLVATHFADGYKIHRFKLATDGTALVAGSRSTLAACYTMPSGVGCHGSNGACRL